MICVKTLRFFPGAKVGCQGPPGSASLSTALSSTEALPGKIATSDMAQKVATAHKMKSRQKKTSLSQIATVTAELTISDKH